MNEELAMLVQLQMLDLKRQQKQGDIDGIPEKINEAKAPLLTARSDAEDALSHFESGNKKRNEEELALKVVEEKIVKMKLRLTDLKTNKEYLTHLHEIEVAKKEKDETEDRLLVAMEECDILKKTLSLKKKKLVEEEKRFSLEQGEIEGHTDEITKSSENLEEAWALLSQKIPKPLFESYKKLYSRRKGLAVVSIDGYTCKGCHFNLPPQLIAQVKNQKKIERCNYCQRILYFQMAEEPPTSAKTAVD